MKQVLITLAIVGALGLLGAREAIFQTDLWAVGEEVSQFGMDQMTRRQDMEVTEIRDRLKAKAVALNYRVDRIQVTRSPQQPKTSNGSPGSASSHDYTVQAVLSREFLFGKRRSGQLNKRWMSTCPGHNSDEEEQKEPSVVEPEP